MAYITFQNVNLTKAHIEKEYEPHLILDVGTVSSGRIVDDLVENMGYNLFTIYQKEPIDDFINIGFKLRNIGKNPALNCKYRYNFNYAGFYDEIIKLNKKLGEPLKIQNLEHIEDISHAVDEYNNALSKKEIMLPKGLDEEYLVYYVLPEGTPNINYPELYFRYYMMYFNTWAILKLIEFKRNSNMDKRETLNVPYEVKIDLKYYDKLDREYPVKYTLKVLGKIICWLSDDNVMSYNVISSFYVNGGH
ncbi:hypothetical protein HNP88_000657 [Methanococcus maripaludis]|uniref:Uncharacterized protein n=1 Tax=Methanococcus maripaludis TaxID=39152 RepID=A0A7J9NM13_METMI|nr:hypothetical protein [Methanococcus maripaludis]MBA2846473.1 hypothetical protein [Methanococcus maripaludis]